MLRRFPICVLLFTFCFFLITNTATAQIPDSTNPTSVDPELLALFNAKSPREFTIAGIRITGTKYLDEALLTSISGLTVGDKIIIPGGDNFSKAITNLWKQNLFTNISIYVTRLSGTDIYLEINVIERPRLASFNFKGISKSESDDLQAKTGLVKGRAVTESMKQSAVEAIKK